MDVVDMWVGVADSAMGCGRSTSIDSTPSFLNGLLLATEDDEGAGPNDGDMWPTLLLLELGC